MAERPSWTVMNARLRSHDGLKNCSNAPRGLAPAFPACPPPQPRDTVEHYSLGIVEAEDSLREVRPAHHRLRRNERRFRGV